VNDINTIQTQSFVTTSSDMFHRRFFTDTSVEKDTFSFDGNEFLLCEKVSLSFVRRNW
jgi:hypothetical protein